MNANPVRMAAAIGVQIVVKGEATPGRCSVRLLSESGIDSGAYYPAQDIEVWGDEQVQALHLFLGKVLAEREKFKGKV